MDLQELLKALPAAATNPYALLSYLGFVIASVIVALRLRRYQSLLLHLKSLPLADRLSALKIETQGVELSTGITPEQWVRSKLYQYFFLAFLAACGVVLVLIVLLLNQTRLNRADLDVSLQPSASYDTSRAAGNRLKFPSYDFVMSFTGFIGDPDFSDLVVRYKETKVPALSITPDMPYLTAVNNGGELIGFRYWNSPFVWDYPRLSFKVVNNTSDTIFLNQINVTVKESKINNNPIPIFFENFYDVGSISIVNEGFGQIINPKIDFNILDEKQAETLQTYDKFAFDRSFSGHFDTLSIPMADLIPDTLLKQLTVPVVAVVGRISYSTETGESRTNTFRTRVSLAMPPPGAPAPPSAEYDLYLEAGKEKYTITTAISQAIKPGDYDNFVLKVASDKYSSFTLDIDVKSITGISFIKDNVRLSIFVPSSASDSVVRTVATKERSKTQWGGIFIEVNKELSQYQKAVSAMKNSGIPIDGDFGNEGDLPKAFVLSFGPKVPPKSVQTLVKLLTPLGLKALDVGEKDFHDTAVYVGSYKMTGMLLTPEALGKLDELQDRPSEFVAYVEKNRTPL